MHSPRAAQVLTCRLEREAKKKAKVQSLNACIQEFTSLHFAFTMTIDGRSLATLGDWESVLHAGALVCQASSLVPNFPPQNSFLHVCGAHDFSSSLVRVQLAANNVSSF